MGGRGYYIYTQAITLQRTSIHDELLELETVFQLLATRSNNELLRLAHSQVIPNFSDSAPDAISNPTTITQQLSLSGIESIYYLDYDGTILNGSHQNDPTVSLNPAQTQGALNTLRNKLNPLAILDCNPQCYQRVFIPAHDSNNRELVVNINRSAALLLDGFSQISGAEVLIVAMPSNAKNGVAQNIVLSSDGENTRTLFQHLLEKIDFNDFINSSYFDSENFFSARVFPLNTHATNHHYVTILKDHAKAHKQVFQTINEIFLSSLLTLAIILILITIILRPSLNRLLKLAKILPLLPQGRFEDARQSLKKLESNSRWSDEIDIVATTVDKVIDSLDSMDQIVTEHKNELALKIDALTEAKVFNETLLDSSPLAIIIHDATGNILNINKLGRELSGLKEQTPAAANINSWVKNERQTKSLSATLRSILNREGRKTQGETSFFTADGRILDFLWTHSSLYVGGELNILSLGVDVTERREASESLRWLGQHDRVTGLLNRSSFTENANHYIGAHQNIMHIELLMLDFDDFAMFNDRHGFDAGDKLLNDFAAHLHKSLPHDTLLSRTGSGEFCALIHHEKASHSNAKDLCLDHLTRFTFRRGEDEEEVCLSGVIDAFNDTLSGIDELISNTTSTMLRVKNKHRGHLYYAASDDDDSSRSSRHKKYRMKEQLLSALNDNRLVLFYQPILDLHTNSISHCECLVRLLDDEGQFIAPAKFLGIASESGLLPRLDYSVIEKAMRQQCLWEESGVTTGLSINVTAPTLEQADFKQRIEELIHLTGANPHRLIFEIVETDAISNMSTAHDLLNHFKSIGAKIAFDDFGIGFTSFEYVRDLPVDYIKIDQSFIRFIHEREQDRVLVKSMVEMSHSLGKKVIVEGVENRAALDIVKDMGVEYVQGYYVCRPMPISALDLSLHLRQ